MITIVSHSKATTNARRSNFFVCRRLINVPRQVTAAYTNEPDTEDETSFHARRRHFLTNRALGKK